MARPSEYDYELAAEICEKIADGGYIMEVLESDEKYPSWATFRRWKRENEELQTLYVNAQQDKTEPIVHHIKQVQKMALDGKIEPSVANVVIQTDKWLASKFYPKMYGDKVDHTTNGKDLPAQSITIMNIDPLAEDAANDSTT